MLSRKKQIKEGGDMSKKVPTIQEAIISYRAIVDFCKNDENCDECPFVSLCHKGSLWDDSPVAWPDLNGTKKEEA